MALWSWWHGDVLPALNPIEGIGVQVEHDLSTLTRITELDREEVDARLLSGHRAYLAYLDGSPVAYGWVATLNASIGELKVAFDLSECDRYLWDFVTLPAWRGRGIYPRLLQAIIGHERLHGRRFWIINAPENRASGAGIAKAGFQEVSDLSFHPDGGTATHPTTPDRARIGAALLGVPLLDAVREGRVLSPCWRCVIAAQHETTPIACWPYQGGIAIGCTCS